FNRQRFIIIIKFIDAMLFNINIFPSYCTDGCPEFSNIGKLKIDGKKRCSQNQKEHDKRNLIFSNRNLSQDKTFPPISKRHKSIVYFFIKSFFSVFLGYC